MEILELAQQRKMFVRTKDRYKYPHKEAMKLRLLWTYDKPPSKIRDAQEAKNLYREICKHAKDYDKLSQVWQMITKGLKLDPRFHAFYAIKGDINMRQKKWTEAIKNFEHARIMAKYDKKLLSAPQTKTPYNKQLIETYSQRGHSYYENGHLIEAASDYEQVIALSDRDELTIDIEDNLLDILRRLDKYDAFRFYWYQLMRNASEMRAATLLTLHAEYKIHLREIVAARQILIQVLNLDKNNAKARELMQIVYKTGHTIAEHTVIWCIYNCYEKALLTVEMARDCDPHNLAYMLLKAIVLRLSGKLTETVSWIRSIDKDFHKFVRSTKDVQESVLGKLTIKQIREQFIEQWYLTLYDMATERMLSRSYEQGHEILQASVKDRYGEACMLLGDSLLLRGRLRSALTTYLQCREKFIHDHRSWRTVRLTERIVRILNHFAREATRTGRPRETVDISERILKILDEDGIEASRLAAQCSKTLLRTRSSSPFASASSREVCFADDRSRFVRYRADDNPRRALFANTTTRRIKDGFAPAIHLP